MSELHNDHHHNADACDIYGFWIYIMSDCILFSCLFAAFALLHGNVYGSSTLKDLSNIPYVLAETICLLVSSFTYGFSILNLYKNKLKNVLVWLSATLLFGFAFIGMELNEFVHLYLEGHSWQSNASMSSFFTLVGTHGLHVMFGLLWMIVLIIQMLTLGITPVIRKRLAYLGLFWAFLDIIWIVVFTVVYLMEAI